MGTENDDLQAIGRNTGSQDGNPPKDGDLARDGYETLQRADGGRPRRGLAPDVKNSFDGLSVYRPRGR